MPARSRPLPSSSGRPSPAPPLRPGAVALLALLVGALPLRAAAQPTFTERLLASPAAGARAVLAADVTGNDTTDVLVASAERLVLVENAGTAAAAPRLLAQGTAAGFAGLATADVTGNGRRDVVAAAQQTDRVLLYRQDDTGAFSRQVVSDSALGVRSVAAADVTGNGRPDLLSAAYGDDTVALYVNDGDGSFTERTVSDSADGVRDVVVADVAGDDAPDVLSAASIDNTVALYVNQGDGTFAGRTVSDSVRGATSVHAADVTGNGRADVLASAFSADQVLLYANGGAGAFTETVLTRRADGARSVFAADVTGNGRPDVLSAASSAGAVAVYPNRGGGVFSRRVVSDSATGAASVRAADLDDDGDADVLAAYEGSPSDRVVRYEPNRAPTAAADPYATDENSRLTVDAPDGVLANDADPDGDPLAARRVRGPARGTLASFSAEGAFKYRPAAAFDSLANGERASVPVRYAARDPSGRRDTATATITVRGTNDRPTARPDTFRTDEDDTLAVAPPGLLANDADPDSPVLRARRVRAPAAGTITAFDDAGGFTFAPGPALDSLGTERATVSFRYAARDGDGWADTARAVVRVDGSNDAPTARPDTLRIPEDSVLTVGPARSVLRNDRDPEGDSLRAVRLTTPPGGTLSSFDRAGTFSFAPAAAFDSLGAGERVRLPFRYAVRDPAGRRDTARVLLTVTGVNDAPTARPDTFATTAGRPLTRPAPGVLANDTDPEGGLTSSLRTGPARGTVSLTADGALTFEPEGAFASLPPGTADTVSFTYEALDSGGAAGRAAVRVAVRAALVPPRGARATGQDRRALLQWAPSPDTTVQGYRVYRSPGPAAGPGTDAATLLGTTDGRLATAYTATGLPNRTAVYFFVTALGPDGRESTPDTTAAVPRPPSVEWSGTVSFGDPDRTSGYRMVGLPGGAPAVPLDSTLQGTAGTDWAAYAAPGITSADGLVAYSAAPDSFRFRPGRGFWVLSESAWAPAGTTAPAPVALRSRAASTATSAVALPAGWSIVTSPFSVPVPWARVQAATPGLDTPLWDFRGSFAARDTLRPYRGYYLFNDPTRPVDSLRIPYPTAPSPTATRRTATRPDSASPRPVRGVTLRARRSDARPWRRVQATRPRT